MKFRLNFEYVCHMCLCICVDARASFATQVDIWQAIQSGDSRASPVREIPIEIAACGTGASRSIVDGPQTALIVGDLKIIVDCFWRERRARARARHGVILLDSRGFSLRAA